MAFFLKKSIQACKWGLYSLERKDIWHHLEGSASFALHQPQAKGGKWYLTSHSVVTVQRIGLQQNIIIFKYWKPKTSCSNKWCIFVLYDACRPSHIKVDDTRTMSVPLITAQWPFLPESADEGADGCPFVWGFWEGADESFSKALLAHGNKHEELGIILYMRWVSLMVNNAETEWKNGIHKFVPRLW